MPYNQTMAEQKLLDYETRFRNLFINELPLPAIPVPEKSISKIIEYYNNLYKETKADDHEGIDAILQDYEQFVLGLEQLKAGKLDIQAMSQRIDDSTDSYYFDVFKHNTARFFMSIFWLSVAASLYVSLFLIALPMFIVQAPIGITVGIAVGGFLLGAIKKFIDCLSDIQSFEPHHEDYKNKHRVLNFFKSAPAPGTEQAKEAAPKDNDEKEKQEDKEHVAEPN